MTASSAAIAMDRMYRRQRHVYDFTRKFYLLGRDRLIARLDPQDGDGILEIGCGTGRNLIEIGKRYRRTRLYGLDVSAEMLTSAKAAVEHAGLGNRIVLRRADAVTFDPAAVLGQARFERVVISYCLSMIPEWRLVLNAAINLLAPGGELHIADFGGQEQLPRWCRAGLRAWLKLFHVHPCDDLEAVLSELATSNDMALALERPYFGYAQIAVVKRVA